MAGFLDRSSPWTEVCVSGRKGLSKLNTNRLYEFAKLGVEYIKAPQVPIKLFAVTEQSDTPKISIFETICFRRDDMLIKCYVDLVGLELKPIVYRSLDTSCIRAEPSFHDILKPILWFFLALSFQLSSCYVSLITLSLKS